MTDTAANIYYQDHYWNDYTWVKAELLFRLTNRPLKTWQDWLKSQPQASLEEALISFFKETYAATPFKKGLVICCGDGRFDRVFIDLGVVERLDSFDISSELVSQAQDHKGSRKIKYFVADANTLQLPREEYDLVINIAALHHVQYVNAFLVQIAQAMKPNAVFFHYEYVGPHRNQWSLEHWALLNFYNQQLLGEYKLPKLHYPQIPLMLQSDPSEAIHSECLPSYLTRYFSPEFQRSAGGAIAYVLLHNNKKLSETQDSIQIPVLRRLLKVDRWFRDHNRLPSLFMFQVSRKKTNFQIDPAWQLREKAREDWANKHLGVYTWEQFLQVWLKKHSVERYIYKPYWYARLRLVQVWITFFSTKPDWL